MKRIVEFKGYRTSIDYDASQKTFVQRREPHPFDQAVEKPANSSRSGPNGVLSDVNTNASGVSEVGIEVKSLSAKKVWVSHPDYRV